MKCFQFGNILSFRAYRGGFNAHLLVLLRNDLTLCEFGTLSKLLEQWYLIYKKKTVTSWVLHEIWTNQTNCGRIIIWSAGNGQLNRKFRTHRDLSPKNVQSRATYAFSLLEPFCVRKPSKFLQFIILPIRLGNCKKMAEKISFLHLTTLFC